MSIYYYYYFVLRECAVCAWKCVVGIGLESVLRERNEGMRLRERALRRYWRKLLVKRAGKLCFWRFLVLMEYAEGK